MANVPFNIALGRAVEFLHRVVSNDPTNAGFVAMLIDSSASDADTRVLTTFSAVLGHANIAEITNSGYSREVFDDSDVVAFTTDNVNHRNEVDLPEMNFGTIAAGDNSTDIVIGYDPNTASSSDDNIVPIGLFDFVKTMDGSVMTATFTDDLFYRAEAV